MLTLYGRPNSSNVRKVLWALALMGLPYDLRSEWGRGFRPLDDPEFRALSPFGLIPVLQDGNVIIRESHTILRYLATKAARHDLYPADPGARAGVEEWMDWHASELGRVWHDAVYALIVKAEIPGGQAAIDASIQAWRRHMQIVEMQLAATGAYIAGAGLTLADIPMGVAVNRWFMTPMERPSLPTVAAYYERLSQDTAYVRHVRNGLP